MLNSEHFPWVVGFGEDYKHVFVEEWSPYLGAVLIAMIAIVLMASGLFWGVFGGLKLWGDYLNQWLGLGSVLGIRADLDSPLLHRISLMNITLVLGALAAALLARQFRVNRAPPLEYLWAALGGTLMALGATLAGGCTTGGFFTPLMFSSPSGWVMWAGLLGGAFLGLKLLLWAMEHVTWGTRAPVGGGESLLKPYYPLLGLIVLGAAFYWAGTWSVSEDKRLVARAVIVLAGFAIGFVLQRSRFCLSRVFREPFMTGEGSMTKAMILALAIGTPVASVLLQHGAVDPYLAIPARFWLGSLLGGVIFGLGMVFAGGCASGSLWRVGEGHLKLVVAVFFFSWMGSIFGGTFKKLGWLSARFDIDFLDGVPEITALGFQAYLPDLLGGWSGVYLVTFALLFVWYLLVRYNESSGRFTVF